MIRMTGKLKSFFILWVILNTLYLFAQDAPDPDPSRFSKEIESFKYWDSKNAFPNKNILFAGSSSIRMWKSAESFPHMPVINRGFGGAHISDMLHYIDDTVLKYNPKYIVFYCGDNDVAGGKNPQQVLQDFKEFVELVHSANHKTRIIYIPIKPSTARWNLWPVMKETNGLIEAYCHNTKRLYYADTATPMLGPDGKPKQELLLDDGLHMTSKGYKVWTDIVKPCLK